MATPGDLQFGRLARAHNLVTHEELAAALRQQEEILQRKGTAPRLGEVMVALGYITDYQAQQLVAEQSMASSAGTKLLGGYELIERIGSGGMGAVYRARQLSLNRTVALKVLPQRLAKDKEFLERFYREARSVAKLSHPNIVSGFDVGEADGYHYLSMEYVDGGNAAALLAAHPGGIPAETVIRLGLHISRALQHAHENGIIHRDIKPENILMASDGKAKLCDLGLARSDRGGEASLTQAGVAVGTPFYISPEQARASQEMDHRADIYSLGATLFHLATGRPPFTGDNALHIMTRHIEERPALAGDVNPSVPPGLSAVIDRMLAKKREDRYQNMSQVIEDLVLLASDAQPRHARAQVPPSRRARRGLHITGGTRSFKGIGPRRVPAAAAALAALAVIGVIGLAVYAAFFRGSTGTARPNQTQADIPDQPSHPTDPMDSGRPGSNSIARLTEIAESFAQRHPDDLPGQIERYEYVLARAGKEEAAGRLAMDRIAEARAAMSAAADKAFAPVREEVGVLCDAGDFAAAMAVVAEPPADFPYREQPEATRLFAVEVSRVRQSAAGRCEAVLAGADRMVADRNFAGARKAVEAARQGTLPEFAAKLSDHLAVVADKEAEHLRQTREQIEQKYAEFVNEFRSRISRRDYVGAAAEADRIEPELPPDLAGSLALCRQDLERVRKVYEAASKAFEQAAPARPFRLTDNTTGKLCDGKFVRFKSGVVTLLVQGVAEVRFSLADLPASELIAHAGLADPDKPGDIESKAVFLLLDGRATKDDRAEALGLARRAGIDVSRYIGTSPEPGKPSSSVGESDAAARIAEIEVMAKAGNWAQASAAARELLEGPLVATAAVNAGRVRLLELRDRAGGDAPADKLTLTLQDGQPVRQLGITCYRGTADTTLRNSRSARAALGGWDLLSVRTGEEDRALVEFVLPRLPAEAKVVSAKVELYCREATAPAGGARLRAYSVSRTWVEGGQSPESAGPPDGSTWTISSGGPDGMIGWSRPGGDWASTDYGDGPGIIAEVAAPAAGTWLGVDATRLLAGSLSSGAGRCCLMIVALVPENERGEWAFASRQAMAGFEDMRPRLVLEIAGLGQQETPAKPTEQPASVVCNFSTEEGGRRFLEAFAGKSRRPGSSAFRDFVLPPAGSSGLSCGGQTLNFVARERNWEECCELYVDVQVSSRTRVAVDFGGPLPTCGGRYLEAAFGGTGDVPPVAAFSARPESFVPVAGSLVAPWSALPEEYRTRVTEGKKRYRLGFRKEGGRLRLMLDGMCVAEAGLSPQDAAMAASRRVCFTVASSCDINHCIVRQVALGPVGQTASGAGSEGE